MSNRNTGGNTGGKRTTRDNDKNLVSSKTVRSGKGTIRRDRYERGGGGGR